MLKERRGELYTVYRLRGSVPLYSVGKLFRYANTFFFGQSNPSP